MSCNCEEQFRIAGNYTKYLIMKILEKQPAYINTIINGFQIIEPLTQRTTIINGVQSLLKDETISINSKSLYSLNTAISPQDQFIQLLSKQDMTEQELWDALQLPNDIWSNTIESLATSGTIEEYQRPIKGGKSITYWRLIK